MKYFFWVCWFAEITACVAWMLAELCTQYNPINPISFFAALYVIIALAIRFAFDAEKMSVAMVALPVLPLVALRLALFPVRRQKGRFAH